MILYLSTNENSNLPDGIANEKALHIRKMSGNFCLSEFIVKDMRKFASCRYFCVERSATTEADSEFIEALQSFQMMSGARIIVIHESENETDSFTRGLVQIGVTNIVTAHDMTKKLCQLAECLSDEGMQRYKPEAAREYDDVPYEEKETLAQSVIREDMEDEQYRFDCMNINIGIIGATRRVGTTTIAMGLANFIQNRGGTACYVALNLNRHLDSIANTYNFDTEEDYYTWGAIDFYEGMTPKHDYNFVISDFGEVKREAMKKYKESDVHLICGASNRQFEVLELAEALKAVRSVKPQILAYMPGSETGGILRSAVTEEPAIVRPVRDMLDFKTNEVVFKKIVQPYIVETSKRL